MVMPLIKKLIEALQKRALNDQELRIDTSIDRTYVIRKIWIINLVKTLRLVF